MTDTGSVRTKIDAGIAEILFHHPRSNSLPGVLLGDIADAITQLANQDEVRVVILKSEGDKVFCGGASFDELLAIKNSSDGHTFFMGFAKVILAIKNSPKIVIGRIQGKAVGGGVGLIAACDYALATDWASVKLSELALGFGPFVISAAVQRKIGLSDFSALTLDTEWRDANWCKNHGLYVDVFSSVKDLDSGVHDLAQKLAGYNPLAIKTLKEIFWEGTDHWAELLNHRAKHSAEMVLSDFAQDSISAVMGKR